MENRLVVFKGQRIRRTLHNGEWWFVVEDVVLALIESKDPKQYIQRMKRRDPELKKGWVQIVQTLSVETAGGPQRMLCANTEGIFRIIQSIPSPKAEPFKRWLAKVVVPRSEVRGQITETVGGQRSDGRGQKLPQSDLYDQSPGSAALQCGSQDRRKPNWSRTAEKTVGQVTRGQRGESGQGMREVEAGLL